MAIDENDEFFPYKVFPVLKPAIQALDSRFKIQERPLVITDLDWSVGLLGMQWNPQQGSREIGGRAMPEPTFQEYYIMIQTMVKDAKEDRARRRHSQISHAVRAMLYRDSDLQVALRNLSTQDSYGAIERLMDLTIESQELANNQVSAGFTYVSSLNIKIKTAIDNI